MEDSSRLGEQEGLVVPLLALGTSHQAAHLSHAGSFDPGRDLIRRVEVALKLDFVTDLAVCRRHVPRTFAGLETDEHVASGAAELG